MIAACVASVDSRDAIARAICAQRASCGQNVIDVDACAAELAPTLAVKSCSASDVDACTYAIAALQCPAAGFAPGCEPCLQ